MRHGASLFVSLLVLSMAMPPFTAAQARPVGHAAPPMLGRHMAQLRRSLTPQVQPWQHRGQYGRRLTVLHTMAGR